MSLRPIGAPVTGILEYELCPGGVYNPYLCTPPRIYKESIKSIGHFFYNPSSDHLVAFALMDQAAWPGWNALRIEWKAGTGEFVSREWCGIWAISWHRNATLGSYNKIFDSDVLGHPEEVDQYLNNSAPMWRRDDLVLAHPIVNLQDNLIAGVNDWSLLVYDLTTAPPTLKTSLRLPNTLGYLCMESREICWVITRDGLILKANYKRNPPRWEMLSSVQNPSPDALNYFVTWDTKRSRLAVLRHRPEAEDGACQSQFEFYQPIVKIAGLTDPVPVSRHHAGDIVEFVAHLYGTAGEGVTPYRILGSLAGPPQGSLIKAEGSTSWNGSVSLLYQAPALSGEDTLILETSINDGAL
jgi:hypothetical protein